ncbi:hypothetical protein H4R18_001798 [Coemansia javaensis]|uniref:Uncharacterized protein n=1 Tax=Coemansia javaensis TaxID=2761396 RepID=A0A9W8HH14_9FUNG|nr:hypothetical protein H4R18_001798 [Coemansia javaensis]
MPTGHLDSRSQTFSSMDCSQLRQMQPAGSEDARRLHQDHKAIKRALDKGAQDTATALSSLHEKASKINLSISDLHADMKKLERMVASENGPPHTSIVDVELKFGNMVRNLESRLASGISDRVAAVVDAKIRAALAPIGDQLAQRTSALADKGGVAADILDRLADVSAAVSEILACVGPRASEQAAGSPEHRQLLLAPPPPPPNVFDASSLPLAAICPPAPQAPSGDGDAAGRHCITFGFAIADRRTSCGPSFSVADAMGRAHASAQCAPAPAARHQSAARGRKPKRPRA